MAEKMDVYSTNRVPFDIAAYCRGHKYSPQAVKLARAVRAREAAYQAFLDQEVKVDDCDRAICDAIAEVRQKMEKEDGIQS